jgi:hypothetical protein
MRLHGGKLEAVLFGKSLDEDERHAMVWDIERGHSSRIEPQPWQTDTCIGDWHYKRSLYEQHGYKTARTVIQTWPTSSARTATSSSTSPSAATAPSTTTSSGSSRASRRGWT